MTDETIDYKYQFEQNYNPVYANGAHGGISALGEIMIHFFLERDALPQSQAIKINSDSDGIVLEQPENNTAKASFVRVIQNGVILNYKTAKELHRWLGLQIEELEKIKEYGD